MARIKFPKQIEMLLEQSDLQAPIRSLADRVGEILADNKLMFFPDYTDHGTEHIQNVLKSQVELVPKDVWDESKLDSEPRLLCDADAVVIIGATLLHDIAMHLTAPGFLELISDDSRFKPVPWFNEDHEGHAGDRPWRELWEDFTREARQYNDRSLGNIIGPDAVRNGWKFQKLTENSGRWERNHCLIIGEFLRRHHARLAHEIAIFGFPGLPVGDGDGEFPAMGSEKGHVLNRFADLIGLTARSHGTSLRLCNEYLDSIPSYSGTPRPMGCAALFPMALLRVADYLQIDRQRAPAVLLQLREPQSPVSVMEWEKHRAVVAIGPAKVPRSKFVTVSQDVSLDVYLQLRDLLNSLQSEIDHSTAVLNEAYGLQKDHGLDRLNLAIRRIDSNLHLPAFQKSLPYVPEKTGFTADPNLLSLLVAPLYGDVPGVGVRELMQNSVDAVRELEVWCETHGTSRQSLDFPDQDADVLIDFIRQGDGNWLLRVSDKGIGMTSEVIQDYFLRAGASFRQSGAWAKEFIDENGHPRVTRAGRFGVGAFAVFLLGQRFKLLTRHVSSPKFVGFSPIATSDSHLIEIRRVEVPHIGTTIEVEVSAETFDRMNTSGSESTDWFYWDWPKVVRRIVDKDKTTELPQKYSTPTTLDLESHAEWSIIRPSGFDAVIWSFESKPVITCNGIAIGVPQEPGFTVFNWPQAPQLKPPQIVVVDNSANLPVTIERYGLLRKSVPFADELCRDVALSFIAHALVCLPTTRDEALLCRASHPLARLQTRSLVCNSQELLTNGLLRWCITPTAIVPVDPWLCSLLDADIYLVHGAMQSSPPLDVGCTVFDAGRFNAIVSSSLRSIKCASIGWYSYTGRYQFGYSDSLSGTFEVATSYLKEIALKGVPTLSQCVNTAIAGVSVRPGQVKTTNYGANFCPEPPREDKNINWTACLSKNEKRERAELRIGRVAESTPVQLILDKFEQPDSSFESKIKDAVDWLPEIMFVAEIKIRVEPKLPESLIAKVWNECLGATPIPIDQTARNALIEKGRQHEELNRHIRAWEEMKRTGAKWVST